MTDTVLIMAGGTGGHVFPALAVAQELQARGMQIEWIGTQAGIESRLVPQAGITLHTIGVQGLRGKGVMGWLMAPFRLNKAVREARQVIRNVRPTLVLGMGGFASGPGGIAAKMAGIPMVIHEQNAIPGLTNRILSRLADRVLEGFKGSFPEKRGAQWLGNPVRDSIAELPAARQKENSNDFHLLVLGGSLGARRLNQVVPAAVATMPAANRPLIRHQCGKRDLDSCRRIYRQYKLEAEVTDFIEDMAAAYQEADLVICRAGALTVAEICAAGVPAVLVPYPHAVDDHQFHNAQALVKAGGAWLIRDASLNDEQLKTIINDLQVDPAQRNRMAQAARSLSMPDSAKRIADICVEVSDE